MVNIINELVKIHVASSIHASMVSSWLLWVALALDMFGILISETVIRRCKRYLLAKDVCFFFLRKTVLSNSVLEKHTSHRFCKLVNYLSSCIMFTLKYRVLSQSLNNDIPTYCNCFSRSEILSYWFLSLLELMNN